MSKCLFFLLCCLSVYCPLFFPFVLFAVCYSKYAENDRLSQLRFELTERYLIDREIRDFCHNHNFENDPVALDVQTSISNSDALIVDSKNSLAYRQLAFEGTRETKMLHETEISPAIRFSRSEHDILSSQMRPSRTLSTIFEEDVCLNEEQNLRIDHH